MLIGLTGGIGSGKSTVSNIFMQHGIPVVDADKIAREVVEPGEEAWLKIVKYFGEDILLPNQSIDREKLGNMIFHHKEKREVLNKITHPIIISRMMNKAKEIEINNKYVILDIPLLFESKREELFDIIIVVYTSRTIQLERLMNRDHIGEKEALSRLATQMSLDDKKEKADIVIYNDKDIEHIENQIKLIIEKLDGKLD